MIFPAIRGRRSARFQERISPARVQTSAGSPTRLPQGGLIPNGGSAAQSGGVLPYSRGGNPKPMYSFRRLALLLALGLPVLPILQAQSSSSSSNPAPPDQQAPAAAQTQPQTQPQISVQAVSYTHLDVYKRQCHNSAAPFWRLISDCSVYG